MHFVAICTYHGSIIAVDEYSRAWLFEAGTDVPLVRLISGHVHNMAEAIRQAEGLGMVTL